MRHRPTRASINRAVSRSVQVHRVARKKRVSPREPGRRTECNRTTGLVKVPECRLSTLNTQHSTESATEPQPSECNRKSRGNCLDSD